ncbi:HBR461Cp [Eremothecium sinecaudum]|uniref:HBR461Cp n=1 Tax=Eremothecium sinecaudum TaxID=45286 RepID=A0A109UXY5_9SACH|nr:HBR461Cp [Eremothecium sinecaudum]AMD19362.1 HBR461Cp [Eremothecium sinecaudum]
MTATEQTHREKLEFTCGITSYDFHTYIPLDEPTGALAFRDGLLEKFSKEISEGSIGAYKPHMGKIGPHREEGYGMFELDVRDPVNFLRLLNYYQTHHEGLSVLIHPRSDRGDLWDHTEGALWLGKIIKLDTSML